MHSSIKAMKTLTKMAKINFFRTLEISQKLPTIWGVFIQEKLLNLIKQDLWHYNLNCSHLPLFRSAVTLKTTSLANMVLVKSSCLATTGQVSPYLELLKKSHSQNTVPIWPVLQLPWKAPFAGIVITSPWLELRTCSVGKAVSPGPLLKTIKGTCLTYQLLRVQYQLGK